MACVAHSFTLIVYTHTHAHDLQIGVYVCVWCVVWCVCALFRGLSASYTQHAMQLSIVLRWMGVCLRALVGVFLCVCVCVCVHAAGPGTCQRSHSRMVCVCVRACVWCIRSVRSVSVGLLLPVYLFAYVFVCVCVCVCARRQTDD